MLGSPLSYKLSLCGLVVQYIEWSICGVVKMGSSASERVVMDPEVWGSLQHHISLLEDIYLRLPLREQLQLRGVCKEWDATASQRATPTSFGSPSLLWRCRIGPSPMEPTLWLAFSPSTLRLGAGNGPGWIVLNAPVIMRPCQSRSLSRASCTVPGKAGGYLLMRTTTR
jgi:hypothetical protein